MNLCLVLKKMKLVNVGPIFPEIPGCASAGDSEEEAITNDKEAVALWSEPSELKLSPDSKIVEVALG